MRPRWGGLKRPPPDVPTLWAATKSRRAHQQGMRAGRRSNRRSRRQRHAARPRSLSRGEALRAAHSGTCHRDKKRHQGLRRAAARVERTVGRPPRRNTRKGP
ncbi:hypothetical protein NDU88_006954 [Pleurodeles waltl]|uniref:Uncharacterized protein n=1 Tax=Pleurodeles waltl TaxID=8319 RepID=A0AAV7N4J0_PLEWA|nr:hypothetical protein NDU88_006954 [Pleurodeles waltl]